MRHWRNGTTDIVRKRQYRITRGQRGYVSVYEPKHPLAQYGGYVYEHRFVMYKKYGSVLPPCAMCEAIVDWKTVHVDHIDERRNNNEEANLRILCRGCNTHRNRKERHKEPGKTSLTANGKTMTASEWSRQPGVVVSNSTIMYRKRNLGFSDYDAIYSPRVTHHNTKTKTLKVKNYDAV